MKIKDVIRQFLQLKIVQVNLMLMSFVATRAMKPKQLFILNTVLLFNVHYVMLVIFAFFLNIQYHIYTSTFLKHVTVHQWNQIYLCTYNVTILYLYVYILTNFALIVDINRIKCLLQWSNEKMCVKEQITSYAILVTLKSN